MASDDIDVSELVETIAVTAREIEENSRVRLIGVSLLLWFSPAQLAGVMGEEATTGTAVHPLFSSKFMNVPVSGLDRVPSAGVNARNCWGGPATSGEVSLGELTEADKHCQRTR